MGAVKKIISSSKEAEARLSAMPKMYLVGYWGYYGVMVFPFSGKYERREGKMGYPIDVPLVYQYDDHNGTCSDYFLRPIDYTTTGQIILWTQDGYRAKQIVNLYEEKYRMAFVEENDGSQSQSF